jgi:sucrose-6-phosphate hydrolase SacC (GH32 family)
VLSFSNFSAEIVASFARSSKMASIVVGSPPRPYLTIQYESADPTSIRIDGEKQMLLQSQTDMVDLHVFMDGSILEVFINSRIVHTHRIYTLDVDSRQTPVNSVGEFRQLTVWEIKPISRDRLTH